MDKLDLFARHKTEYAANRKPALLKIGPALYLAIAGKGAPGSEDFAEAIGALYGVAFTVKMRRKAAGGPDYAVGKLEALWPATPNTPPAQWPWRLMIRTPEFVTEAEAAEAAALQIERGKSAMVRKVELLRLDEGRCVQALHVGPYEKEAETFAAMSALAESKGLKMTGAHHEIYLSDPRRVAPDKLRTILRCPVGR